MSDKEPQTHRDQQAERDRERERARAEAEASGTQAQPEHTIRTDNRRGRENTSVPEHTREEPPGPAEPAPFGANPKPALKLMNIDGGAGDGPSWIDFAEPVPSELIEAIRENSKDGPVTIWSRHLVEPDFSALLWNWIIDGTSSRDALAVQLWEPPTETPPKADGMEQVNFSAPAKKAPATPRQTPHPATTAAPPNNQRSTVTR